MCAGANSAAYHASHSGREGSRGRAASNIPQFETARNHIFMHSLGRLRPGVPGQLGRERSDRAAAGQRIGRPHPNAVGRPSYADQRRTIVGRLGTSLPHCGAPVVRVTVLIGRAAELVTGALRCGGTSLTSLCILCSTAVFTPCPSCTSKFKKTGM